MDTYLFVVPPSYIDFFFITALARGFAHVMPFPNICAIVEKRQGVRVEIGTKKIVFVFL